VKLKGEGFIGAVRVVTTTEPLITRESLLGLAEAADVKPRKDPQELAEAMAEAAPKELPIEIQPAEGCDMQPAASIRELKGDEMVLQFSAPFVNPFVRGGAESGVFARLSLAGEAPQWYWVPLKVKDGKWFAGMPRSIAVPH
jgi:hypothetical protein